jgi:hypothetical protein
MCPCSCREPEPHQETRTIHRGGGPRYAMCVCMNAPKCASVSLPSQFDDTGWELRTCQVGGRGGLGDFTMRHACMPIPRCAVLKVQWGRAASSDLYSVLCGSHRPWTVLWTVKSQFGVTLVWVWTLESAVAWGDLVRASRFPSHTWPSYHEVVDGPRPPLCVEAIGIAEKVSGLFIRTGDRTRSPERTDHENGSDSVPGTSAAAAV